MASVEGGTTFSILSFSPFMLIFAPIAKIFENYPILMTYFFYYIAFLSWFLATYKILFDFKNISFKNSLLLFVFMFASEVVLFHYGLNHNGFESVFFAVPFLILSYNYAFIENNIKTSTLWYLPLLTIKFEFWFLFIFYSIALAIHFKNKHLLWITFISAIAFVLNMKLLQPMLSAGVTENQSMLAERYGYIFESTGVLDLINKILSLSSLKIKIALIVAFFIPFLTLVDFKKITLRGFLTFTTLLMPTLGYSILSTRVPMSYWTHEHYSLPVVALMFVFVAKYINLSKIRVIAYFMANIAIFSAILYIKQPWQYKYYADENQLLNDVIPKLELDYSDVVIADNKSGLYFSKNQFDDLENFNKFKRAKYIVINTRYEYLNYNIKFKPPKIKLGSKELIKMLNIDNQYQIVYLNFPFVVYEDIKHKPYTMSPKISDLNILNKWDKEYEKFNKWL
jgi:hypothetical protein